MNAVEAELAVKEYTECIEWRKMISKKLRTRHIVTDMRSGVHWTHIRNRRVWDSYEENIQRFCNYDWRCSIYSLYAEMQTSGLFGDLPDLVPGATYKTYCQNNTILKRNLWKLANIPWDPIPDWVTNGWDIMSVVKDTWVRATRNLKPLPRNVNL